MRFVILTIYLLTILSCTEDILFQKKSINGLNDSTELSDHANQYFWKNFHEGNYNKLDSIIYYLSASYNENPNHLETVTHLGFSHIWKLSERDRLKKFHQL